MHVGVVGAGPAGLCAAKHATAQGMKCTVFEQIDALGGIWVYNDKTGTDRFGLPIHTSLYKNLKLNLPKELVMYPDFPHKVKEVSYLNSEQMLGYLNEYTDHYDIRKCVKFNHHVKKVSRSNDLWEIVVIDLLQNQENIYHFDVVFICNGRRPLVSNQSWKRAALSSFLLLVYIQRKGALIQRLNNTPVYPTLKGLTVFKGKTMHTHDYRVPNPFLDKRVLIIGGGPSALDISNQIADVSVKVVVSHHSEKYGKAKHKKNVFQKPDVKEVKEYSVVFEDDTEEEFDAILFATGYTVNYSFLDESCGISINDRNVFPLYKFIINANEPTMCIIGNLIFSIQLPVFDLQIRFFLKSLHGEVLPNQEQMIQEISEYTNKKLAGSNKTKKIFVTNDDEDNEYFATLAVMANIDPIPPVMGPLYQRAKERLYSDFQGFRNDVYEIVNPQHTFLHTIPNKESLY